ncbi:type II toxin-antitoxin system HipA family toxin [Glaciimonas sp. GG7]
MECQFQIFVDDQWLDCATISVQDPGRQPGNARNVFEYNLDYAFDQTMEPVSLRLPVDADLHVFPHWPAFFYDLIPQGAGRQFLLGQLGWSDGPGADFSLVCAGAFNPIGRVRVAQAVAYFQQHIERHDPQGIDNGLTLQQIVERGEAFHERMMVHSMLAAGTTGVQGAAPKYLLTADRQGLWHADGALPDTQAAAHFIVKRPRGTTAADKKVLKNEAAYMRVAQAMGIRTPGTLDYLEDLLFIPRFDRAVEDGKVIRHHQESLASLAGLVGFDARPSQFELLNALRTVVTDKTGETIEFLKRDVLNLAMRNTDNHARNTAVQKIGNAVRLTPLFDFAPMYLDPEGIARAARWYHPISKKELTQWQDVIAALALTTDEADRIRLELYAFGLQMPALGGHMRQAGVDADIVTYLQPAMDEQIRQLNSLGENK